MKVRCDYFNTSVSLNNYWKPKLGKHISSLTTRGLYNDVFFATNRVTLVKESSKIKLGGFRFDGLFI